MVKSILVICTGNICRSPVGERLLTQYMPHILIRSAGIRGLEGYPADERTRQVAAMHGISLDGHVSRKLTLQMMRECDLILGMELDHLNYISAVAPEIRGKSLLFAQWGEPKEIPDPYNKSDETYEYVFALLGRASKEWVQRLNQQGTWI